MDTLLPTYILWTLGKIVIEKAAFNTNSDCSVGSYTETCVESIGGRKGGAMGL